jgi:integrase/recombinase XerD
MLERYLSRPCTLRRLRGGHTGPFLDGFAKRLSDQGFSPVAGRQLLSTGWHLGEWLAYRGCGVSDLDEDLLARFDRHLSRCRCSRRRHRHRGFKHVPGMVRRFVGYLREVGAAPAVPEPAHSAASVAYAAWMRNRRGLSEWTNDCGSSEGG